MESKQGRRLPHHGFGLIKFLLLLLFFSLSLNLFFFFFYLCYFSRLQPHPQQLRWFLAAAAEAEAVAAIDCSGHGRAFLDSVVAAAGGLPTCECNTCYGGSDCSRLSPDCPVDADGCTRHRRSCSMAGSTNGKESISSRWANASSSSNFIEFVTSPNNPDGVLRRPVLNGLEERISIYSSFY